MGSKEILSKFVNVTKNPLNNQVSLHLRKSMLKEQGFEIEDVLNAKLSKKLKQFKDG